MVRHKSRSGSVLVQKSGHVDDDVQISALNAFYEMDGRKSPYIGEVMEWYRGEDASDLKRSELNELVENVTCLNALEEKIWKSDQKGVMDDKINQKIVMCEGLVQNEVMDGKFLKNFVMDAKFDPKVVIDLAIFEIGGWNSLQPKNQNLLEEKKRTNRDTVLGTTLCEFRSTHEEVDVTSSRSSCDDAMLHATALC